MKVVSLTCPNCGAKLDVNPEIKNITCNYCGHALYVDDEIARVQIDNPEQAGYEFEKGRQRAQAEQNRKAQTPPEPPQQTQKPKDKKRILKIILWALGWIYIFPIPLTILMLRKKAMKPALRIGIIVAAWIVYLGVFIAVAAAPGKAGQIDLSKFNMSSISTLKFSNTDDVILKVGEKDSSNWLEVSTKSYSTFSPEDVLFISENPEIATIELKKASLTTWLYYTVTAISPGETTVYACTKDKTITSEHIKVIVPQPIEADRISIKKSDTTLAIGETKTLEVEILPENAEDKTITWESSDSSILSVEEDGTISAHKGGSATITAKSANGVTDALDFQVDGSKHLLVLKTKCERKDSNNIGDEWSKDFEINGKSIANEYRLTAGEKLDCFVRITESDENPDIGKASTSYTVTESDLINGFKIEMTVYVRENGGRNSGEKAQFLVTYEFSPS